MFFQILGWLFCLAICLYLVVAGYLAAVNNLGQYNIGGVPNTFATKFWTLIFYVFVVYCWYLLFHYAPFSINFEGVK
jgi:hypothetical protein